MSSERSSYFGGGSETPGIRTVVPSNITCACNEYELYSGKKICLSVLNCFLNFLISIDLKGRAFLELFVKLEEKKFICRTKKL